MLPLLKRRRTAANDSTPKRDCSGPDLSVTDNVTAKESAKKRRTLNEPDETNIAAVKNCVISKEKQGQQASAAEARARILLKRGIGDLATLTELESEAARQKAAGTHEYFGASAATKLRKQLAASTAPPVHASSLLTWTTEDTGGATSSSSSSSTNIASASTTCVWCLRYGVTALPGSDRCLELQRDFGCHRCDEIG